jgi:calcineurin-like phosphoesterase family protein
VFEAAWPVGNWRSIAGMSDSIFLLGDDGSLTEAHSTAYQAEAELQALLAGNVHLLPGRRSTGTARAGGC